MRNYAPLRVSLIWKKSSHDKLFNLLWWRKHFSTTDSDSWHCSMSTNFISSLNSNESAKLTGLFQSFMCVKTSCKRLTLSIDTALRIIKCYVKRKDFTFTIFVSNWMKISGSSVHFNVPALNTKGGCKSQWLKVNGDEVRGGQDGGGERGDGAGVKERHREKESFRV